jgi:hypothetical protein
MRILFNCFLILLTLLFFVGCASKNYLRPVREVDKTINLPEGSKSISPYFRMKIYPDNFSFDISWLEFPQISYGITNNLCYPMFPMPVLQYAVINNNKMVNDTVFIDNFNLSLIGGLTGFLYTNSDGFSPILLIGFNSKYRISNSFWGNFDFKCIPELSKTENKYSFIPNFAIGYQFFDNFFATISYQPDFNYNHYSQSSRTYNYFEHEGRVTLGFDPNYYFGIRIYSGYTYRSDRFYGSYIPLGASLIYSW